MDWDYDPATGQPRKEEPIPVDNRWNEDPATRYPKKKPANQGPPLPPGSPVMGSAAPGAYVQPAPAPPPVPPPAPVQPIAFNGGHYNPTTAPFGFDQSMPGVQEQFWNNNQGMWFESPSLDWVDSVLPQFQDPWAGEQAIAGSMGKPAGGRGSDYWDGISGSMNSPTGAEQAIMGGYKGPNNAQTAFDITKGRLPGSFQPGFDAYYDRMHDKVMSDVNSQSAARGVYGSNSALNNSIGAGLDVEANRSKAHTDFMFADSANQRNWLDSLSNQGRSADQTGLDIFGANKTAAQFGLDKTKTLADIAFEADRGELDRDKFDLTKADTLDSLKRSRLDSGISTAFGSDAAHRGRLDTAFDASGQAQDQREGRVNTLYNQLSGFSNDVQDFVMQNYDALLGGDTQMSDQELEAMIAQTADERGWNQQTREVMARDLKMFLDFVNGQKENAVAAGGVK